MIHPPANGHRVFEFSVYNQAVRELVKANKSHSFFDDHWADIHLHDVVARDEMEAKELILERFPPSDGFVVQAAS